MIRLLLRLCLGFCAEGKLKERRAFVSLTEMDGSYEEEKAWASLVPPGWLLLNDSSAGKS